MHIENPDALKGWLTTKLAPLCDADPAALARYVCALLKKVKPEKELQASMQEQLDVFLGAETQPFLDRLMDTIRTEEYLQTPLDSESADSATASSQPPREGTPHHRMPQSSNPTTTTTKDDGARMSDDDALRIDTTPTGGSLSGGGHSPIKPPLVDPSCPSSGGSSSTATNNSSRRQQRLSARSRSRSRSPDRRQATARNPRDSRDRLNRPSGVSSASYRNKSPPGRRFEHHRRGAKGGPADRYSRRNHSRSRSRSHSPSYRGGAAKGSLSPSHNNNNNSQALNEGESRIQSQIVVGGSGQQQQSQQQQQKGKKCRDFEEKGYCMRGETCPWDHGVDPVVLEDINNPTLMTIQQQQQHLREYNPDAPDIWTRNNNSAAGGGAFGPRGPIGRNGDFHSQQQQQRLPFRLSSGQVVGGGGMMNPGGLSQLNRELIPVPVMMDGQPVTGGMHHNMGGGMDGGMGMGGGHGGPKRRYEDQNQPLVPGMEGMPKRRPLAGRLGGRVGGGPGGAMGGGGNNGGGSAMGQQNCSLELRKVPRGLNSIAHLNNHFSKFGKIINIQVNYENDPEAAIVTFSSHAEANVAYRSTEAVLNNRFIKVFWHNNNNNNGGGKDGAAEGSKDGEAAGPGGAAVPGMRKPNQYHLNNVLNKQQKEAAEQKLEAGDQQEGGGGGATPSGQQQPAAVIASPAQLRLRTNRGQAMRRKQEEQVKQAVQMAQDLMKKKHDLLQEYLKQMRSCLELIEKVDATDPQRAKLLQTLKDLQGCIDKLRKEIADEQKQLTGLQQQHGQNQLPAVMRMTKEQQQKELLDLELELIAQQQEGNDTTHIQRRIQDLQRALGRGGAALRGQAGVGAAAGGQMMGGRGRVAPPGSTSVDRRPTTIFVAGFKVDDSDALLGHFKHFGEITKNVLDPNIPSLIISFAVRSHAEQAMQRGRIFKEKPLQINWYIPNFIKQRQPNDEDKQPLVGKVEPVEGEGAPDAATPPMATAAEIKKDDEGAVDEMLDAAVEQVDGEEVVLPAVKQAKMEKTELELEDELIGGDGAAAAATVDDELPSVADVDDELRLDDEEDDLEDRSWRR